MISAGIPKPMQTTSMTNIDTRSGGGVPNPVVYVLKGYRKYDDEYILRT